MGMCVLSRLMEEEGMRFYIYFFFVIINEWKVKTRNEYLVKD